MADILFQKKSVEPVNIPEIQISTGGIDTIRDAAQMSKALSDDMKKTSMTLFGLELETQSREDLNAIFKRNASDPDNLTKEIKAYQDGVEKKIPFAILPEVRKSFVSMSGPLITKASSNRNKVLDGQLGIAAANNQSQILLDINNNAENLINLDPTISNEEKQLLANNSFNAIANSFESLRGNLSLTKADGSPLYTPTQQVKILQTTQTHMLKTAAMKWLENSPNKIEAYKEWIAGNVNITTVDANNKPVSINIRNSFSPDVVAKVDKDIVKSIKDDLWINSKLRQAEEAFIKDRGEEISKNLEVKSQDNVLTLAEVEQQRGSLTYHDYRDFRKKAITGSGLTDGGTYASLADRSVRGQDISQEVRHGMFKSKTISYKDGRDLIEMNRTTEGFQNSVTEGRRHLTGILGVNVLIAGEAQTAALARANTEYNRQVNAFTIEMQRQPNFEESIAIAERVAPAFSIAASVDIVKQSALPTFVDDIYKTKPNLVTKDVVEKAIKKTKTHFIAKYNGDLSLASKDKELQRQLRLLDSYDSLAFDNEKKAKNRLTK